MLRCACLFLIPVLAGAQTVAQRVDALIQASPAARQAFWGIRVVDLESGAVVYQKNEDHFFVPASNTKLFSTSLALTRLGPDYRFITRDRKSTRLNSSHQIISYAVFCLK